jgi:predicted HicB family RNase H-like nuclease
VSTAVRLPVALYRRLVAQAQRRKVSVNLLIEQAVERSVGELEDD